jgi:hypothetical protein
MNYGSSNLFLEFKEITKIKEKLNLAIGPNSAWSGPRSLTRGELGPAVLGRAGDTSEEVLN